jgi:hypothetical protein
VGRLKRSLHKSTEVVNAISHFNSSTRCIIDTCGQWLLNEKGQYYPMLKCVFWCFPQCVAPIISVHGTLLTGKYKDTLMVDVSITAENHLLPLAFTLLEGENNES